ncbi:MAG: PLP-dependent transferase, partial [Planctomycetota bacterium]|nr:PLP-dependent transferase [Planctomycetota bacterium]
SPILQRPLDLGMHVVMHSATKYLGGHSDVVGGVLATRVPEIAERLRFLQNSIGSILGPFDAYLCLRGIKTLGIRMERHSRSAMEIARMLEAHEKVERVVYPGLPSHPQHEVAARQMGLPDGPGFGGMITMYLKGDIETARRFLENVRVFALAESLGGVESLIEHPAIMTHASVPPESRAKLGISDTLVRLSVGIEDLEDLMADVKSALDAC